jgi:hypothetical protein
LETQLPSTSIASLPDVAGNPKHIDNPFLWIASNFFMFSVGVIEVEGNILPVDIRIEEIAVRQIAKMQSKNIAEPVKQQLEEYLSSDDIYEQQESPFGKAMNQAVV